MARLNEFGQPIGDELGSWTPPGPPPADVLVGRTVVVEPLDWSNHGRGLFEAFESAPPSLWTYMTFGPFGEIAQLRKMIEQMIGFPDWSPYAIVVDERPLGFASYLRIQPTDGVIEIGAITLAPRLQKTTPATEALYLMIKNIFDLGYRRCEWKCDALNESSIVAGKRLGFRYEGTFQKATHYKGRNRDTAWLAITDDEWAELEPSFETWLAPDNFDNDGAQKTPLGHHMKRPPGASPIKSINAVTLSVSDMERSVEFYESMGFELAYGGPSASFTSFRVDGQALNLIATTSQSLTGWGRVILYVDDVDEVHRLAVSNGHSPEARPADASWGERYFHLDDPDGHQLSFARPL